MSRLAFTSGVRLVLAVVALAAGAGGASPALAACKIAAAGGDLTLTVALDTEPGGRLEVDWGDGASSHTARTDGAHRKAALMHQYAAPGVYQVVANDTGPAGCGTELEAPIPYDSGDDRKSQDVLPPLGPPAPDQDSGVVGESTDP